jgi:signal transduction histidine kinase
MTAAAAAPEGSVVRSTLRALLHPKRLVPVLFVSTALVLAQGKLSRDPLAVPLGVLLCLLFVLVAPVSFRVLFPDGLEFSHGAVRLVLYGAIGTGVVAAAGVFLPSVLKMGRTLLTAPSSVIVCVALFLVGGWGLGRDIGFEARLARAERRSDELRREAERAQLLAVRAHLDPHFLFNTLNAIAEWCRTDGAVAEEAIVRLAGMLRTILAGVRAPAWSLAEELALCEDLLALHRLRDPALFTFTRTAAPDVDLEGTVVPPMLLLPLFENAVKHGPGRGARGAITLSVQRTDAAVGITLESPGAFTGRRPGGQGLAMVEQRLALAYGARGRLTIDGYDERTGDGYAERTRVTLTLPADGTPETDA